MKKINYSSPNQCIPVPKRECALFIPKDLFVVSRLLWLTVLLEHIIHFTRVDSTLLVPQFCLSRFLLGTDHKWLILKVERKINKITIAHDRINPLITTASYRPQWKTHRCLTLLYQCTFGSLVYSVCVLLDGTSMNFHTKTPRIGGFSEYQALIYKWDIFIM